MLIAVTHETVFEYSADVTEGAMEVRLAPATNAHQTTRSHLLRIDPRVRLFPYRDYFGATVHYFTVPAHYRRLAVVSKAVVETIAGNPFAPPGGRDVATEAPPAALYEYRQFGGPVVRHPELAAIAAQLPREPDLFTRLQALSRGIHDRLEYQPLVTQVDSTLDEVLSLGKGVCQDFAHLMIGVCREMGVPARYVSGYVYMPASGSARGSGASHAWCECYLPDAGWKGFDPTNNLLVDEHYVQIAAGRDYRDVPPTKGIYRGSATETISVTVRTDLLEERRGSRR